MYKTGLYACHEQAGAKFIDFSGWHMPLNYGSQMAEHMAVRQVSGIFDVSHMGVIDLEGPQAKSFLQYLLANDVAKCRPGKEAIYTCMLNDAAGVIDDLIVYMLGVNHYRCVVNAGGKDNDWLYLQKHAQDFQVSLRRRDDLAIIAWQGPQVRAQASSLLPKYFQNVAADLASFQCAQHADSTLACTGYTGEDGYEIILPVADAEQFWQRCMQAGVQACGLGARDSLRLEMGYRLQGSDMHAAITPLEAGLSWTVAWRDERHFIGKTALLQQKQDGVPTFLQGLYLGVPGMLHVGDKVASDVGAGGVITSAAYSPILKRCVAMARFAANDKAPYVVQKRGKSLPLCAVRMPFIKTQNKEQV